MATGKIIEFSTVDVLQVVTGKAVGNDFDSVIEVLDHVLDYKNDAMTYPYALAPAAHALIKQHPKLGTIEHEFHPDETDEWQGDQVKFLGTGLKVQQADLAVTDKFKDLMEKRKHDMMTSEERRKKRNKGKAKRENVSNSDLLQKVSI